MSNALLQSIRNQILKYEKEHGDLHGKIHIYIPQPDVIQTLNILIKYRLDIFHVENNCITILINKRADKSFLQEDDRLEDLDITWTVSEHINFAHNFSTQFKTLNPFIENSNITNDEKSFEFKIKLPCEQIINRNGLRYYKYKEDVFIITEPVKKLYDLIHMLNNLIWNQVKNFSGYRFEILKFQKAEYGYYIQESDDISF